jgi:nucleotide-binding universal stress UspA family protein
MFTSILVPIDVAHRSSWEFALPQALELAAGAGARVTALTVVRDLTLMLEGVHLPLQLERIVAEARTRLARIAAPFEGGAVSIEQDVRVGSIVHEILAAAESRGVDLIVMASHRPEMRDYLIGPNAAAVAQRARCSVLVLRRFAPLPEKAR